MGLWMATALVVGNMIGSGVFLLPSALAAEAGPISLPGEETIAKGFLLLTAGIPVYVYLRWRQSREQVAVPASPSLEPAVGAERKLVEAGQ
jgi:amino acid transporter